MKHGQGNDGVVDLSRAAEVIRRTRADVVVLQEIDDGARRTDGQDQMAVLSQLTGLQPAFGAFMPYQGGHYGMGILSRFPILESRNHRLPDGAEPRTALDARLQLPDGSELMVCGVHLYATAEQRLAQASRLVELYADNDLPMILGGDFNSEPNSEVMELVEAHWVNADKGEDRLTFPATEPRSEIDFVLYRPADRFEVLTIDVLDEPVVSDHRPVLLVVKPRAAHSTPNWADGN
ncbi:MAG: endonuclease/exonuclease/phosphatase family protein [Planctomycetota bacterium]